MKLNEIIGDEICIFYIYALEGLKAIAVNLRNYMEQSLIISVPTSVGKSYHEK